MLRFLTAGESHGKGSIAIIEGVPANLPLEVHDINVDLVRRQGGYGRGGRQKIEKDAVEILSGVRHGKTLGSPIALFIDNRDFENWQEAMSVSPIPGYQPKQITRLRPGHADLPGVFKYHQEDLRNILERSSARETAIRVAVGAVARRFLDEFSVAIHSHVTEIGSVRSKTGTTNLSTTTYQKFFRTVEKSPVRCADSKATQAMIKLIDKANANGDSLGGIFEVMAWGLPIGLGSHVHWDRRLEGELTRALMSLNAVKGVEIGMGFEMARGFGSEVHDEIFYDKKKCALYRKTNNAGGLEGGMTNGMPLVLRAALKPISTLRKPLRSVDFKTKEPTKAHFERADTCAVPAAGVIGEALVSIPLMNAWLEKFGGDCLEDIKAAYRAYLKRLNSQL